MTSTDVAPSATTQLPEEFVSSLRLLIPEDTDPELYKLLSTDPFASRVRSLLDGHHHSLLAQGISNRNAFRQLRNMEGLFAQWRRCDRETNAV